MSNELGKTLSEILRGRYVIPLYQRNFAWRTEEVQQLLQDIYEAHEAFRKNQKGNYYIGSLVVMKRHNGDFEVVDGQQRLTVISLIAIIQKKLSHTALFFDSRPEVQRFFETLCVNPDEALHLQEPSLFYLKEAYECIQHAKMESKDTNETVKFLNVSGIDDYFLNHVVIVRNEIPEDTDVAAYFEIMNNRGEQLQKHELVKAEMLEKIRLPGVRAYDAGKQHQFAGIWDSCSQMDVPIQRLFLKQKRKEYFGEEFDGFSFTINNDGIGEERKSFSLAEILDGSIKAADENQDSEDNVPEVEVYEYGSLIDFPNFLMHVLKLYLNVVYRENGKPGIEIPLNEKDLLAVYREHEGEIDSMRFIKLLLFCRTAFDRFIVKTAIDERDQEDGQRWILVKPRKYSDCWKFAPTFEGENNAKIIKAVSMLQVTFRARIYKNWLYEALEWLYNECFETGELSSVSPNRYLSFLHGYMLKYYSAQGYSIPKIKDGVRLTPENSFSKGTETPHFLLNFIDYLYCCKNPERFPKSFDFKYWNSVEHHLAQNKAGHDCPYIDNLGNLCLVSRSANSRLSDRDVKEKVEVYGLGKIGPNRRRIYDLTREAQWNWGEDQIRSHYNELADLLDNREQLLKHIIDDSTNMFKTHGVQATMEVMSEPAQTAVPEAFNKSDYLKLMRWHTLGMRCDGGQPWCAILGDNAVITSWQSRVQSNLSCQLRKGTLDGIVPNRDDYIHENYLGGATFHIFHDGKSFQLKIWGEFWGNTPTKRFGIDFNSEAVKVDTATVLDAVREAWACFGVKGYSGCNFGNQIGSGDIWWNATIPFKDQRELVSPDFSQHLRDALSAVTNAFASLLKYRVSEMR